MRKFICITFTLVSLTMLLTVTALAITACPDPVDFTQPNGTVIQVTQHGDEFLSWTEDSDGSLILFDSEKNGYYYANWTDDGPESTRELVGSSLYPMSLSKHDKGSNIPHHVLERARRTREETMPFSDEPLTAPAPANPSGAPAVNSVEQLKRNLLIIHVRWQDESNISQPPLTNQEIHNLVFNPNTRSVNNYYKELFGTQENIIIPAETTQPGIYQGIIEVTLPGQNTNAGNNSAKQRDVLQRALDLADDYINFAQYDTNGNKTLETSELSIGMIVHGFEASYSPAPEPNFWGVSYTGNFGMHDGMNIRNCFGLEQRQRNQGLYVRPSTRSKRQ